MCTRMLMFHFAHGAQRQNTEWHAHLSRTPRVRHRANLPSPFAGTALGTAGRYPGAGVSLFLSSVRFTCVNIAHNVFLLLHVTRTSGTENVLSVRCWKMHNVKCSSKMSMDDNDAAFNEGNCGALGKHWLLFFFGRVLAMPIIGYNLVLVSVFCVATFVSSLRSWSEFIQF